MTQAGGAGQRPTEAVAVVVGAGMVLGAEPGLVRGTDLGLIRELGLVSGTWLGLGLVSGTRLALVSGTELGLVLGWALICGAVLASGAVLEGWDVVGSSWRSGPEAGGIPHAMHNQMTAATQNRAATCPDGGRARIIVMGPFNAADMLLL